jgi:hypothetical protein
MAKAKNETNIETEVEVDDHLVETTEVVETPLFNEDGFIPGADVSFEDLMRAKNAQ